MIELDWYHSRDKVSEFTDSVRNVKMNFNGFIIIANNYGRITNACYGNVKNLYLKFSLQFNSNNFNNLKYFSFTKFEEDNFAPTLDLLIKSLYWNLDYEKSKSLIKLPSYILFSDICKYFHISINNKIEADEKFNDLEKIFSEANILDKVECNYINTTKRLKTTYDLLISTTSYYNREFEIGKMMTSRNIVIDNFNNNKNKSLGEIVKSFGQIIDWPPESQIID